MLKVFTSALLLSSAVMATPAPAAQPEPLGKWIVKLKQDGNPLKKREFDLSFAQEILSKDNQKPASFVGSPKQEKSEIFHEFDALDSFSGFAFKSSLEAMKEIAQNPRVEYIKRDAKVKIYDSQQNPTWGINRVDQRSLPLDSTYKYPTEAGSGVTVYVIDTGITAQHPEFEGRASEGGSFVNGVIGTSAKDNHGHGTHCAGTVASKTYGVAKKAKVVGLKVLGDDGTGSDAGVIAALNWVAKNGIPNKSVASMSLGPDFETCVEVARPDHPEDEECNSKAVRDAVSSLVKLNIPVVVAAGNDARNACDGAPASEPLAYTVAASTSSDRLASFSNFGTCVDIIAPGQSITSTWLNNRTNTISGTSMACPHVAGGFAVLLSKKQYTSYTDAYADMSSAASVNKIKSLNSATVNRLLFVQ
ncbi:hypothetical protein HDU92_002921 [Lobulomyces angularis]|nr:hypothetical protein HDU92_002921 [Lobulomyces angularis]